MTLYFKLLVISWWGYSGTFLILRGNIAPSIHTLRSGLGCPIHSKYLIFMSILCRQWLKYFTTGIFPGYTLQGLHSISFPSCLFWGLYFLPSGPRRNETQSKALNIKIHCFHCVNKHSVSRLVIFSSNTNDGILETVSVAAPLSSFSSC